MIRQIRNAQPKTNMRPVVAGLMATVITFFCSAVSAAAVLSPVTQIVSVYALEGYNILRIQVGNTSFNPGACDAGIDVIDVQLDVAGRSAEEQRQLLNAINLAFMTQRNVRFYVRDDLCSTAGTSSRLRIAVGVQVLN